MLCIRHLSLAQVLNTTESLRPTGFKGHVLRKETKTENAVCFRLLHISSRLRSKRCYTRSILPLSAAVQEGKVTREIPREIEAWLSANNLRMTLYCRSSMEPELSEFAASLSFYRCSTWMWNISLPQGRTCPTLSW